MPGNISKENILVQGNTSKESILAQGNTNNESTLVEGNISKERILMQGNTRKESTFPYGPAPISLRLSSVGLRYCLLSRAYPSVRITSHGSPE